MANGDIISVYNDKVPTIVSFDIDANRLVIGESARHEGLNNQTNMFNFKMDLGLNDREFNEKKYWYGTYESNIAGKNQLKSSSTFSAKEVTKLYLGELLKDIVTPEKLILGIPAVREVSWRANYKRHMEEILKELGYSDVDFFFEPFAVFQYYRHYENKFPFKQESEIILVIDIGGGTFNSCIIQTTSEGNLSRSGANMLPLGLQAEKCGGTAIDQKLLQLIVKKAQDAGVKWKDNPESRAKMPALIRVEEAKIALSEQIGQDARFGDSFGNVVETVTFTPGVLHPEKEISATITGDDLKEIIGEMWHKHYGDIILQTIAEAETKFGSSIAKIDKVIVAGGSAKLPFMRDQVELALRPRIGREHIVIGDDLGNAVAYGIACECRELVKQKKYAGLSVGRIAPCLLTDLYICFRKERNSSIIFPYVNGEVSGGLLFSTPFETQDKVVKYSLEINFDINEKLYYYFTKSPVTSTEFNFVNVTNYVFSVPGKVAKKFDLELHIKQNGSIVPTFIFKPKGGVSKKSVSPITVHEVFIEDFEVKEGEGYLGIDFGTSNSYVAKLMSFTTKDQDIGYPKFEISGLISEQLREVEIDIQDKRESGTLTKVTVQAHSKFRKNHMLYHSNKIENINLTKGETESAYEKTDKKNLTTQQVEAINHKEAFEWILENYDVIPDEPESFIRNIHRTLLGGVERHPGIYRTGPVKLSGMSFTPPPAFVVPNLMKDLADEIKQGVGGRSAIEFAASIHTKFVMIHPFVDGNGRTARLLMNGILLQHGLPILIVNYADKQRYFDCIEKANSGSLSDLVGYYIECYRQEISFIEKNIVMYSFDDVHNDKIFNTLVCRGEKFKRLIADRLKSKMRVKEENYNKYVSAFQRLSDDFKQYQSEFNENETLTALGIQLEVNIFDQLTFDKYEALALGESSPTTWFVSFQLKNGPVEEKILLRFQRSSEFVQGQAGAHPVSIGLSRYDGHEYRVIEYEPINLKEMFFCNGDICAVLGGHEVIRDPLLAIEEYLLADVMDVYFEDIS